MDINNDLKLQILKKEGEIDSKSNLIGKLEKQLELEMGNYQIGEHIFIF